MTTSFKITGPCHKLESQPLSTRWFKYNRDKLWLVYTQIVPVIFEPPCNSVTWHVAGWCLFPAQLMPTVFRHSGPLPFFFAKNPCVIQQHTVRRMGRADVTFMTLGVRSQHHVLVAFSEGKLYFTHWLGGYMDWNILEWRREEFVHLLRAEFQSSNL
jgi:hypothetical protein